MIRKKLKIQRKIHVLFENESPETAADSGVSEGSLSGPYSLSPQQNWVPDLLVICPKSRFDSGQHAEEERNFDLDRLWFESNESGSANLDPSSND